MRTLPLDADAAEFALAQANVLTDLEPAGRAELARAAMAFAFDDGDVIVSEGAEGTGFYVMRSGRARVERGGTSVGTLEAGDVFGEVALLEEGIRTASVIADGPVEIIGISRSLFRSMLARHPRVAMRILEVERSRER